MFRDRTKEIQIGSVKIGAGNPVAIQSMTNTKTEDVKATVGQILALEHVKLSAVPCQRWRPPKRLLRLRKKFTFP